MVDLTMSPEVPASGDPIPLPNRNFRHIFQNINGKFKNQLQKNQIFTKIISLTPDSFGFAEPNLHWNHTQKTQYQHTLTHHWPHHRSAFTHCNSPLIDDLTSDWLPGGAVQSIHGQHASRNSNFYSDIYGRWISQTLRLKQ